MIDRMARRRRRRSEGVKDRGCEGLASLRACECTSAWVLEREVTRLR